MRCRTDHDGRHATVVIPTRRGGASSGCGGYGGRQWLWHVRGSGRRHVDLHAQQRACGGTGVVCGRSAERHDHGIVGGWHRQPGDHHHHHRDATVLAAITGAVTGGVGEDTIATVSGVLTVTDDDTGEAELVSRLRRGTAGAMATARSRFWPTARGPTRSTTSLRRYRRCRRAQR